MKPDENFELAISDVVDPYYDREMKEVEVYEFNIEKEKNKER